MKLAFYYHINIYKTKAGELLLPSYIGIFIDALATEVKHLYLLMHTCEDYEMNDYLVKNKNITLIDLGLKSSAWHRIIFHKKILQKKLKSIECCDAMLVRCPSPLAPYFKRYLNNINIFFYIVGDYQSVEKEIKIYSPRNIIIKLVLKYYNYIFIKQIKYSYLIVNSPHLKDKYQRFAKSIDIVKTTTLLKKDLFNRKDTCTGNKINLLYTGRIDLAKGLMELVVALYEILKVVPNTVLHIVGWEDSSEKPIETKLISRAKDLNIDKSIIFHGKKSIGDELNCVYRMADIYIIPSYNEGFPRTIWEAMANSLPVIATNVGSIPIYLKNGLDAILIEPKNKDQIVEAIQMIIYNSHLRRSLIASGKSLANENILENQTKLLMNIIHKKCCIEV